MTPIDLFALFNGLLFLASTPFWPRFLPPGSRATVPEFLVYAVVILAAITALWLVIRRLRVRGHILVLVEVAILLHFAGGLIHPGGVRLYDLPLGVSLFNYPLCFDKVVHLVGGFIGCLVVLDVLRALEVPAFRLLPAIVCLCVLGVGAVIEIVEYVVMKTIPHNGVGDYDNNMTDLAANLLGCVVFTLGREIWRGLGRLRSRRPGRPSS